MSQRTEKAHTQATFAAGEAYLFLTGEKNAAARKAAQSNADTKQVPGLLATLLDFIGREHVTQCAHVTLLRQL